MRKRSACVRSASLISTTRMSPTIASSILRRFSACASRESLSHAFLRRADRTHARDANDEFGDLRATRVLNDSASNPGQYGAPCNTDARTEMASSFNPATIAAVPSARSSQGSPSPVQRSP